MEQRRLSLANRERQRREQAAKARQSIAWRGEEIGRARLMRQRHAAAELSTIADVNEMQKTDLAALSASEEEEARKRRESKAMRGVESRRVRGLDSEEKEAAAVCLDLRDER